MMIMPPRLRSLSCRAMVAVASRLVLNIVSSRLRLPTNAPVLMSMVVIASMIGVKGLGQPVLRAVTNQYFALGLFAGGAVVALAIVFDRTSQGYGKRLQKFREL